MGDLGKGTHTAFIVGDHVTVIKGPYRGKHGTVWAVTGIFREKYTIDFESGVMRAGFTSDFLSRRKS